MRSHLSSSRSTCLLTLELSHPRVGSWGIPRWLFSAFLANRHRTHMLVVAAAVSSNFDWTASSECMLKTESTQVAVGSLGRPLESKLTHGKEKNGQPAGQLRQLACWGPVQLQAAAVVKLSTGVCSSQLQRPQHKSCLGTRVVSLHNEGAAM